MQNQATVLFGDVFEKIKLLIKADNHFDLIYADPPYARLSSKGKNEPEMAYSEHTLRLIDESSLLTKGGTLFIEEASEIPLDKVPLQHLQFIKRRSLGRSVLYQFAS